MPIEHETPADGNIFADLGFPEAEAERLNARSNLMIEIHRAIQQRGLSRKEAAKLFGVSPQRITALMRGHIDSFTDDDLIGMLAHAGMGVDAKGRAAA
ncbi:helix-turn-helix transcriptional regulator [Longimicrobium sp.]|uniref:helix-turn-helix domain-containing protein n=1 Tax=Longimicrobium sp. TaxID=2029185 RepID=UPI002CB197A8|nr:helix-turn-helix transcriptional regulator [Longimicrobium sp.]HSU13679.1 helix-turn-helix transcriptional regulator [Longimicrobium sp.]